MQKHRDVILAEVGLLLRSLQEQESRPMRYLDDQDVMQMLHVCSRTLRKLRKSGELPYSQTGRKFHYLPEDVHNMILKNRKG